MTESMDGYMQYPCHPKNKVLMMGATGGYNLICPTCYTKYRVDVTNRMIAKAGSQRETKKIPIQKMHVSMLILY